MAEYDAPGYRRFRARGKEFVRNQACSTSSEGVLPRKGYHLVPNGRMGTTRHGAQTSAQPRNSWLPLFGSISLIVLMMLLSPSGINMSHGERRSWLASHTRRGRC